MTIRKAALAVAVAGTALAGTVAPLAAQVLIPGDYAPAGTYYGSEPSYGYSYRPSIYFSAPYYRPYSAYRYYYD